ncbi:MAG: tRNA (guanosine(46)-N7)-methyltransferase TrmB [Pirellulaceae bacterium]|nr:tRNA (guanosine(46)-N7)-methyltransferase TrmB [Pirellulaceae bacterium]
MNRPQGYFRNPVDQSVLQSMLEAPGRIELEVGSGKGLFMIEAAARDPDTRFIGLELAVKYAELAQKRLEEQSIENGRFFACDAVEVVSRDVPDQRLSAVHVYFPDPWWKARHKKRRVLNDRMLKSIQRVLEPNGVLHFWTDVLDYYESTLELLAEVTTLVGPRFVDEPVSTHSMDYRTHFERRTRLNGLPVYRCQYVAKG